MKDFVKKKEHKTKEDLIRLIVEAQKIIPMKTINNYIDYTCDLIPRIIENKGEFSNNNKFLKMLKFTYF